MCQHFANSLLDTCSEDIEWVRKKTLLYPREINLCLSFIHYSFHEDAGGAAAFFSTLRIRSTAAALSHKNRGSASPRKQDKSRNGNSICLLLLVPLGFWRQLEVQSGDCACIFIVWNVLGNIKKMKSIEFQGCNFKQNLEYWGASKVRRTVFMR